MAYQKVANIRGPIGPQGLRGLPGADQEAADDATAAWVGADDSATGAAVQERIDAAMDPGVSGVVTPNAPTLTTLSVDAYSDRRVTDIPIGGFRNLKYMSALYPKWSDSVARVRAGSGFAKVLCIGDSTSAGNGNSNPNGYLNQLAWPARMATYLDMNVARTNHGLVIPPATSDNPANDTDTRWTLGSGWSHPTTFAGVGFGGQGSLYVGGAGATGALTFSDTRNAADTYDIYFAGTTSTSMGTIQAQATGGAAVTKYGGEQATKGIIKITVTAAAVSDSNVLTIRNASANQPLYIVGVEQYAANAPRIRVANAGCSRSTTADWLKRHANDADGGWNVKGFLPVYAPDLTIIDLGINDAVLDNRSVADYIANIQTIIGIAQGAGSAVMLKTMIPSNGSRAPLEADYVAALRDMSGQTYTRVPVLDLLTHFGSYERTNAAGMMTDNYHGNDVMYDTVGRYVAECLQQFAS